MPVYGPAHGLVKGSAAISWPRLLKWFHEDGMCSFFFILFFSFFFSSVLPILSNRRVQLGSLMVIRRNKNSLKTVAFIKGFATSQVLF